MKGDFCHGLVGGVMLFCHVNITNSLKSDKLMTRSLDEKRKIEAPNVHYEHRESALDIRVSF